ncbi:MAG: hypothetical protein IJW06_07705 [Clostridia bacterium]|nr:hypothetical protein [Clostridia bacterium]
MWIFNKNTGKKVMIIAEIIGDICIAIVALLIIYSVGYPDHIFYIRIPIVFFLLAVILYAFGRLVDAAENIERNLLTKSDENNAK